MTHVGAQRKPNITRWILVGTIIFCFAGLLSYFSYIEVAKPTMPTIDIPKLPPSQVEVPPPSNPNTNPAPVSPTTLEIETEWDLIQPKGVGEIYGVAVDYDKETLHILTTTPKGYYFNQVWKSSDWGNTWEYVGLITEVEMDFRDSHEFREFLLNPRSTGLTPGMKKDQNNPDIILKSCQIGRGYHVLPDGTGRFDYQFWTSFDGEKTWSQLVLSSILAEGVDPFVPHINSFDLISSEEGLKVFIADKYNKGLWRTTINLP